MSVPGDIGADRMHASPRRVVRVAAARSDIVYWPDAAGRAAQPLGLEFLGDQEGEFERLAGVQPRVAKRLVAVGQSPRP